MTMMIADWLIIDGDRVAQTLLEAQEKLDGAKGELVLDFSAVCRVDPGALRAMEAFAGVADEKSVKVALRGVNVDVYKVLKLAKLTPRFAVVN
jgi:anti-anti-sigma regulatory factor